MAFLFWFAFISLGSFFVMNLYVCHVVVAGVWDGHGCGDSEEGQGKHQRACPLCASISPQVGVVFYQFTRLQLLSQTGSAVLTAEQTGHVELLKAVFRLRWVRGLAGGMVAPWLQCSCCSNDAAHAAAGETCKFPQQLSGLLCPCAGPSTRRPCRPTGYGAGATRLSILVGRPHDEEPHTLNASPNMACGSP